MKQTEKLIMLFDAQHTKLLRAGPPSTVVLTGIPKWLVKMVWCSIAVKTRHCALRSCLYHWYHQGMIPACFVFQQPGSSQSSKSWAAGKAELILWDKTKVTALFQVLSEINHIRE